MTTPDDLPRAAWPPPPGASGGRLRIDPHAGGLVDAARPSAITVRRHDVELAFDGAIADRDRIGAAIELAAWWACDRRELGPYR